MVGAATGTTGRAEPDLARAVGQLDWYHTIELPGGIVTRGYYDHRRLVSRLPIPASLAGRRCLDLASADGFWAFELARRGAAAVVSVDLSDASRQDWQGGPSLQADRSAGTGRAQRAFELAQGALGMEIERHDLSVYDLSPERLGTFDLVFMGNVLLHLSDPGRALLAVRSVTGGELLSFEAVSLPLSVLRPRTPLAQLWARDEPRWWTPNMAGHRRLLRAGGFEVVDSGGPLFQRFGAFIPPWPERLPASLAEVVFWLFVRRFGVASAWAVARPTGP